MTEHAVGVSVKIERAKEHISDLEAEISAFKQRNPYTVVHDVESKPGHRLSLVRVHGQPSAHIGAIASDAIHNLRSALDILWVVVTGAPNEGRKTYFPIHETAETFERRFSGKIKSPLKSAVDLLRVIKPYQGGTDALWHLQVLDNADKHHMLTPVGTAFVSVVMAPPQWVTDSMPPGSSYPVFTGIPTDRQCPLKDGAILWDEKLDPPSGDWPADVLANLDRIRREPDDYTKFIFDVAFSETEILHGEPILPTLMQIAGIVESVAKAYISAGLLK